MTLGIIQERPGLGSLLGAGLGQGLQRGITSGADYMMKLGLQKAKQNDPFKLARNAYLNRQSIVTGYNQEIDTLRKLLDSTIPYSKDERLGMQERLKNLYSQKEEHLNMYDSAFGSGLGYSKSPESQKKPQEKSEVNEPKSSKKIKTKPSKIKFNPENPEHKSKATQLYKTYKDKDKVKEILSREFEF